MCSSVSRKRTLQLGDFGVHRRHFPFKRLLFPLLSVDNMRGFHLPIQKDKCWGLGVVLEEPPDRSPFDCIRKRCLLYEILEGGGEGPPRTMNGQAQRPRLVQGLHPCVVRIRDGRLDDRVQSMLRPDDIHHHDPPGVHVCPRPLNDRNVVSTGDATQQNLRGCVLVGCDAALDASFLIHPDC